MTFFELTLQTRASLHPDGEPDEFISSYTGFIHAAGDDGVSRKVGKVHAWRINAGLAANYGASLLEACDAHSQPMLELYSFLYEPGGYGFKEKLVQRFDAMEADCLVLDYIVLHPKWRGLKLGLLAARRLIDLLGNGCGLVVCELAPVRHTAFDMLRLPKSWLPRHETREDKVAAVWKLRRYFAAMGFRRIKGTPFHGMSLSQKTPTLEELLKPVRR